MKKRGIEWTRSVDENRQDKENRMSRVQSALGTAILDVICALIFMWSAVLAVTDVYGVESPKALWFLILILISILTSALMELPAAFKWFSDRYTPIGVLAAGVAGFGGYLLNTERWTNVRDGLVAFLRMYIRDWNAVYDMRMSWYVGNEECMELGVWFFFLALSFFALWISKKAKRRGIMAAIPITVFTLVLLVGKVPGRGALFLLLVGILLLTGLSWEKPDMQFTPFKQRESNQKGFLINWMITSVSMIILSGVVLLGGTGLADKLVQKHSDDTLAHFAQTADSISDWALWNRLVLSEQFADMLEKLLRDVDSNYVEINNEEPMFDHIPVLEVSMNQSPAENVYLKGYYGDFYEEGFWKRDLKSLEWACHTADIDYEKIEGKIAILPVEKLAERYQVESLSRIGLAREITVDYIDLATSKVYLPYFAEIGTHGLEAEGDSYYTKRMNENSLFFLQWNQKEREFVRENKEKQKWELWYEEYVMSYYLEVPENMETVRSVAEEIEAALLEEIETQMTEEEDYFGPETVNDLRMLKAESVADWMLNNTTYSLSLPALPEGTDPIEYFLGTTKTGYCMHYASASVMLLRELGVPARYASGYIATKDTFQHSSAGYDATILDDQAHAWVEVYLEGMGWMPVEVTKTYPASTTAEALMENLVSTELVQVGDDMGGLGIAMGEIAGNVQGADGIEGTDDGQETEGAHNVEGAEGAQDAENAGDGQDADGTGEAEDTEGEETAGEAETSEGIDGTGAVTGEGSEGQSAGNGQGTASGTGSGKNGKGGLNATVVKPVIIPKEEQEEVMKPKFTYGWDTLVWALCILAVFAGVVAFIMNTHRFFSTESVHYKQLRKEIRRGNYRDVIIMINNAIYRKLCFNKLLQPGHGDIGYEIALKTSYPELCHGEWDRYMEIVKAATFSEREFTKAETKFCYEIYRDVVYKNEIGQ